MRANICLMKSIFQWPEALSHSMFLTCLVAQGFVFVLCIFGPFLMSDPSPSIVKIGNAAIHGPLITIGLWLIFFIAQRFGFTLNWIALIPVVLVLRVVVLIAIEFKPTPPLPISKLDFPDLDVREAAQLIVDQKVAAGIAKAKKSSAGINYIGPTKKSL
jgi:hypothetical protein